MQSRWASYWRYECLGYIFSSYGFRRLLIIILFHAKSREIPDVLISVFDRYSLLMMGERDMRISSACEALLGP